MSGQIAPPEKTNAHLSRLPRLQTVSYSETPFDRCTLPLQILCQCHRHQSKPSSQTKMLGQLLPNGLSLHWESKQCQCIVCRNPATSVVVRGESSERMAPQLVLLVNQTLFQVCVPPFTFVTIIISDFVCFCKRNLFHSFRITYSKRVFEHSFQSITQGGHTLCGTITADVSKPVHVNRSAPANPTADVQQPAATVTAATAVTTGFGSFSLSSSSSDSVGAATDFNSLYM